MLLLLNDMISDIPTPSDFEATGLSLLNLAWDTVSSLYLHAELSEMETWDDDGQVTDEFWKAAHQPLSNAQALIHQGVEFLLKARIVEVSPYLLLDRSIREWPKGSNVQDTAYAEFRTIDAQDLVRVHDTVTANRLDPVFSQRIDDSRRTRNAFTHSVDKRMRHSPENLWLAVLDISHHLIGPEKWIPARRQYLEAVPRSVAFRADGTLTELSWECTHLLAKLKPAEARLFLGVEPKARWYICYNCSIECSDAGRRPETAQLKPNKPDSGTVYCFVCGVEEKVRRIDCTRGPCKGNVVHDEDSICLTCYQSQD